MSDTDRLAASARIAAFAAAFTPARLAPRHLHLAARALIDTYAVAIAGRREPASLLALDYAAGRSAPLMASAWGSGLALPLEEAALYNGIAGHVLDFDDVNSPMRGHPSIALLPPLVALAEALDKSGLELATAFALGFEVIVKLSKAMAGDHYARGWHSTASIGTLGAAVGCARLLGLDQEGISHAIGLALAQTAGSRANFGTMAKSFQAGQAGAAALRAALLAQRGFTSTPQALDGAYGYLALYGNGEDLQEQLATLGGPELEILASGIEVKKYPLCYATHRALDGVLDLRAEHGLRLDEVERVAIRANYRALAPLIYPRPQTGLEGKFSMHYAVACALQDGHVRLSSFSDAAVQRPALQQALARIEASEADGPFLPRWTEVRIYCKDGRELVKMVRQLRGAADCPISDAALVEKAEDCFAHGGRAGAARAFAEAAFQLERRSVREILAAAENIERKPE